MTREEFVTLRDAIDTVLAWSDSVCAELAAAHADSREAWPPRQDSNLWPQPSEQFNLPFDQLRRVSSMLYATVTTKQIEFWLA